LLFHLNFLSQYRWHFPSHSSISLSISHFPYWNFRSLWNFPSPNVLPGVQGWRFFQVPRKFSRMVIFPNVTLSGKVGGGYSRILNLPLVRGMTHKTEVMEKGKIIGRSLCTKRIPVQVPAIKTCFTSIDEIARIFSKSQSLYREGEFGKAFIGTYKELEILLSSYTAL